MSLCVHVTDSHRVDINALDMVGRNRIGIGLIAECFFASMQMRTNGKKKVGLSLLFIVGLIRFVL